MMMKEAEGRIRAKVLDESGGERKSLRWISFVQRLRRMFLSFVLEHGGEKGEICGDR